MGFLIRIFLDMSHEVVCSASVAAAEYYLICKLNVL